MTPSINVRAYRPRQVILTKRKRQKEIRRIVLLSPSHCKPLGLMVVLTLVLGFGLTQFFHVRIVELRFMVAQLQTSNTVIAAQNNRIETAADQVASKAQIVAIAKRKLQLFEPDHGQVRRM